MKKLKVLSFTLWLAVSGNVFSEENDETKTGKVNYYDCFQGFGAIISDNKKYIFGFNSIMSKNKRLIRDDEVYFVPDAFNTVALCVSKNKEDLSRCSKEGIGK